MHSEPQTRANVAAARNEAHTQLSVRRAFRDLLDTLNPALPTIIRTGDHVLVKPFLRHGLAGPESRMISHPEVIRMVIESVKDCGGIVTLGDAGPDRRRDDNHRLQLGWIHDIAKQSGANPVSFSECGARYVKSRVFYPRRYLLSRAVLDVDKIIGCANFQPHGLLVWSGATKNMFNAVVGKCQQHLHDLYPHPDEIARVIVDVCSIVKPAVSFLDLTTVVDYARADNLNGVGMLLASADPIALDTVAVKLMGFRPGDVSTIRVGDQKRLGCSDENQISVTGLDWQMMQMAQAKKSPNDEHVPEGLYDRATRFINKVLLRPGPFIDPLVCTGCHDCQKICPVQAVAVDEGGLPRINSRKCAHCNLCIEACDSAAISLQFGIASRAIRRSMNKSL
jgi:uncharacterized protein (DUF362 family)/Pyruvate/2-oxoacid:ferredoxin oxidoreductase delta subunit